MELPYGLEINFASNIENKDKGVTVVGKFVCGESIQKVSNSLKETYEFLELHLMKILNRKLYDC